MPYQPAGNSGSGSKTAKMSQLKFWSKQNNNKQQEKQLQQDNNGGDNLDGSNNGSNNNGTNNTNNNSNSGNNNSSSKSDTKNNKRNWLHTPEQLINGHAVYLVKFFGNLSVDQPKGIEVVKDAIRKLQFAQQMKKAETGTQEKFKKLEITISIKGVAIQEPRTHKILHQFPLYNISYCADEKGVKKFFSFIAKTVKNKDNNGLQDSNGYGTNGNGNGSAKAEESHECFVFISNKLASDITLTIGQAFDLAYRKFMDSNEKTNLNKAQQQIEHLQQTIAIYKERLRELSAKLPKSELDAMLFKLNIKDILEAPAPNELSNGNETLSNGKLDEDKLLIDTNSTTASTHSASPSSFLPIVPPRSNLSSQLSSSSGGGGGKNNSQKMDELLLNSDSDSDFDPRADEIQDNLSNGRNAISNDLFGFEPSKSFGQQLFFTNNNDHKLQNNNNNNINLSNNNANNLNNVNNNMSINSSGFSNELNITPPLLAPPPKIAAPRRTISQSSSGNPGGLNGNTDLFGSDPFEMNNGPSVFKSQLNIDDFSLESLDPLRK